MSETSQFKLPLVAAAQAQKHVTVNEGFARLDAMAQMRLQSVSETVPPVAAADGDAFAVPLGAVNTWDGHSGEVALFANGGWVFLTPLQGWRAWVVDAGTKAVFDGDDWHLNLDRFSPFGAGTFGQIIEFDHVITAGASNVTPEVISDSMLVFGVTGRVVSTISGTGLTGWKLGVSGAEDRYGSGLSLGQGAWVRGMTGQPLTYWGGIPLSLTSVGGDFAAGTVRLAIHGLLLEPPRIS